MLRSFKRELSFSIAVVLWSTMFQQPLLLMMTMIDVTAGFLLLLPAQRATTTRCTPLTPTSRRDLGIISTMAARQTTATTTSRLFLLNGGGDDTTTKASSASSSSSSASPFLDEEVGGYTTKQRLREEIESPFRKVRLLFFASTTGSALTALYFSAINVIKASSGIVGGGGGFDAASAPPPLPPVSLDEALSACAINLTGAIVCAILAYREYQLGQANLERIRKGGLLASLVVLPAEAAAATTATASSNSVSLSPSAATPVLVRPPRPVALKDYRRSSRVVIAAGGRSYLSKLCRQLNADQLKDQNTLPQAIETVDLVVVPVLLVKKEQGKVAVAAADTQSTWMETVPVEGVDRGFDLNRASAILAFPYPYRSNVNAQQAWSSFLESEIETAQSQGFDVLEKGFTITVKKNGRILRRATGLPPWRDLIGTMEVLDGKFGMPGDDERY